MTNATGRKIRSVADIPDVSAEDYGTGTHVNQISTWSQMEYDPTTGTESASSAKLVEMFGTYFYKNILINGSMYGLVLWPVDKETGQPVMGPLWHIFFLKTGDRWEITPEPEATPQDIANKVSEILQQVLEEDPDLEFDDEDPYLVQDASA